MVYWWRGRGLWIPFIVALPVVSAADLGGIYVPLAYLAAALFVFALRDWLGESASVFSIPVRYWPPLMVALALLIAVDSYFRADVPQPARPPASVAAAAPLQAAATSAPAPVETGLVAFESWARQDMKATDIRYVSGSEIWIALQQAPPDPLPLARDGAAHYRKFMAKAEPVKLVLFANNARLAEAIE